jgi:DNA-binding transcriptional MerR regulator
MFKIGDFSKLSQVTIKTLRYYDEIGLLKPASVDRFTGYRYYSAEQLPRLNRILALKDLGLSLEDITRLLNDDLPSEQIRGMFRMKQAEIQNRLVEEQMRLARVEARLKQIEQEGKLPAQEVVVKSVTSQKVAAARGVVPTYGHIGQLFEVVYAFIKANRIHPAGPSATIYHDQGYRAKDVDVEAVVPFNGPGVGGGQVEVRELPHLESMATVVHQGGYESIGGAYQAVTAWIEQNNCRVAGLIREVYLQGVHDNDDPATFVTEVQVPVEM